MAAESSNRTVGRIAKLLESIVAYQEPQRLVDLVRAVDAPASSVHLLLQELCRVRMVRMSDDKRYSPGPALVSLALQVVSRERIVDIASPVMSDLAKAAREDVYLALPQEDSVIFVHRVRSSSGLRLDIDMGKPSLLHATAVGQLYLAVLPVGERNRLIDSLVWEKVTDRTITDRAELEARVDVTAQRGWALSDREGHPSVVSLAGPVYNRDGRFAASLCISAINDNSPERLEPLISMLTAACADLSGQLAV
ncbi:IclR family transcriptional regulator [Rhodococcus sp. NPDC057529]|uniref:IclR family transcriptional regulator n=1 Tax=Rhodococcus sp. NPDC057529 TaxID=3346158 RepID=UPI00366E8F4B